MFIPEELATILGSTKELRSAFLVGGCVRDWLLGQPNKDFDIEVFGVSYEQLAVALSRWGRPDLVGRSFGVLKLTTDAGSTYDFNIPRRESKVGIGHTGFVVELDPAITPKEAASRRDYTINALTFDPRRNELLDFFGGRRDLQNRVLRHTSKAFAEDPLRVLRGMQFAGRFALRTAPETLEMCRRIAPTYRELAIERVWGEWYKWATRSVAPSLGLRHLVDSGWTAHFPEVDALQGTPQDPEWHPEGDVFEHTRLMLQFLPEKVSVPLVFAVLLHDVAKPRTATVDNTGRIRFNEHDRIGAEMTEEIMRRLRFSGAEIDATVEMVRQHMVFKDVPKMRIAKLKRFMARPTFEDELELHRVDCEGSHRMLDNYEFLLRKREEFANEPIIPPPLVRGDDLIALGLKPGPKFREILDAVETGQLEGTLRTSEEALEWVKHEYGLGEGGRTQ